MEFRFDKLPELEGATLISLELLDDHSDDSWRATWQLLDGSEWSSEWLGFNAARAFCIAQIGEEMFNSVAPS